MLSNHPNCLGGNGPSASSDLIGDVDGPASATDNAVARFDGTTGKLIQNSVVTIADTTGAIAGASSLTSPAATDLTLAGGTAGSDSVVVSNTLAASSAIIGAFKVGNGTAATNVAIGGGKVNIGDTTAGSANAGALVLAGGISAGNTGSAASYFGGSVTLPATESLIFGSTFGTGTLTVRNGATGILTLSANTGIVATNYGFAAPAGTVNAVAFGIGNSAAVGLGMYSPSANALGFVTNATERLTISSTGAATFAGDLSAQRLEAVDAAASNRAAAFIRTQNNTTYSSSVLSIQGDRTTSNSSYNLIAAANGDSSGQFAVRDSGNVVNTNNSYGAISDQKLKENIVDATAKLQKLNQVRIVNFNRIGNEQKQIGVIAQELEQIFPSMIEVAIDRDAEGNDLGTTTKSVKYSVFVPMLIKAVQELTARLAALEAK